MVKRSEDEKIDQTPIIVILGGKEYPVKPLVIKDSMAWRRKVVPLLSVPPESSASAGHRWNFLQFFKAKTNNYDAVFTELLITIPSITLDLFFEYAKELNREEIEGGATEEELATAFNQIMAAYFPLSKSLPGTVGNPSR